MPRWATTWSPCRRRPTAGEYVPHPPAMVRWRAAGRVGPDPRDRDGLLRGCSCPLESQVRPTSIRSAAPRSSSSRNCTLAPPAGSRSARQHRAHRARRRGRGGEDMFMDSAAAATSGSLRDGRSPGSCVAFASSTLHPGGQLLSGCHQRPGAQQLVAGMSRWKPVKQPVFGSSAKQCARCGRWFSWANYWRDYKRGYVDTCTKCLARARVRRRKAKGTPRTGHGGSPRRR